MGQRTAKCLDGQKKSDENLYRFDKGRTFVHAKFYTLSIDRLCPCFGQFLHKKNKHNNHRFTARDEL
jgi:hypothetical protein